jgi:hypothetical protein
MDMSFPLIFSRDGIATMGNDIFLSFDSGDTRPD